jgi:peptidoglycan/LPS O-acetylase OafA/YrhL
VTTIAERMDATRGRTTGFDYLRLILASAIILWHGIATSYGQAVELGFWRSPIGVAYHFVLPMFFALSGFLVCGSLDRCPTLISFFALRVLRIVPALAMEVLLSALLLGPALTVLPAGAYFADARLHAYFLNMIGDIHYVLPGLFVTNPVGNTVNAQLWTMPYELMCYLALGGLALSGLLKRRVAFLAFTLLTQAIWAWHAIALGDTGSSNGASGEVLVVAFLGGLLIHLYRDRIVLHAGLFAAVTAIAVWLSTLPHGAYYLPLPAAYMVVYLGLLNPPLAPLIRSGDYSYGLYLYGYPLQQAVAWLGPPARHWWINVGIALPAALLVAVGSWHLLERRALALRRTVPGLEAAAVGWHGKWRRPAWNLARPAAAAWLCVAGIAGTFLLVDGHDLSGIMLILSAFAVAAGAMLGEGRASEERPGALPLDPVKGKPLKSLL